MALCHECGGKAHGECVRCRLPTCPDSYFEQEHLGLCRCCADVLFQPELTLVAWPYALREPLPERPLREAGRLRARHLDGPAFEHPPGT